MSKSPRSGSSSGASYVGIDPASSVIGLAAIDEAGNVTSRELDVRAGLTPRERREPLRRLVWLCDETARWLRDVNETGVWCCVLELPLAHHGGASLLGAVGALGMTAQRVMPEVPVHQLIPASIDALAGVKKVAGVDRKALIRAQALTLGYDGDSQDVADAVVAAAAARTLTLRATEAAA